jgi:L-arabinose isomerase
LQPEAAIDYARFNALESRTAMTGEWLAYCSSCPVPEIANVFTRAGIPFHQVTGVLEGDPECWEEIEGWMQAAQTAEVLSNLRLGLMGHYYGGMLDIATDLALLSSVFGPHIEMLEIDELSALRAEVFEDIVDRKVIAFADAFDIQPDCAAFELERAARTAVALDNLVERHSLGALAYFYNGNGCEMNQDTITSIILGASMLTSRGVSAAGEYEVKNVLAMKIIDSLGAGGSFTEFYTVDYRDDVVLMGHDGPCHAGIAEGKVKVKPLSVYHGKVGRGLSVEMSVMAGPVTLLSVVECKRHGFRLLFAHGEIEPGPILEIGNTNSRYRFPIGARAFLNRWNEEAPAHHCAVGHGHIGGKIEKLAKLLGIDAIRVC